MICLTTNGFEFEIDEIDKDLILLARWKKPPNRHIMESTTYYDRQYLHIIIAKRMWLDTKNYQIDHKDNNKCNNKRNNLRIATQIQNSRNSKKRENASSQYKGVSWDTKSQKWVANIELDRGHTYLGSFHNEEDAKEAYNNAALKYFGEFARINEDV
jgi:hypothetical protein